MSEKVIPCLGYLLSCCGAVPVFVIAGPTASGKSAYALERAAACTGMIINADSQQLYDGLPFLTAQPSPDEKARVPHALYAQFPINAPRVSAATWAAHAEQLISSARLREQDVFIVGGTGFYINALLNGLSPIPPIPEERVLDIRESYASLPAHTLHHILMSRDPESAKRISSSNPHRILRALTVLDATGTPLSVWQKIPRKTSVFPKHITLILPARDVLRQRIRRRAQDMFFHGVIDEVRDFLEKDPDKRSPLQAALGVQEITRYLRGDLTREQALDALIHKTCQYARRQTTWFRHQITPDIVVVHL